MAWNQLLFGLTVTVILFSKGCHSEILDCGRVPPHTRAPGDDDHAPGNWPWLVSLSNGSHHFCSASLINKQWVLTSASCISRGGLGVTVVFLGRYNQLVPSPDEVSRTVVWRKCHNDYDSITAENDICLLKLSAPVNFTATLRPVCLAEKHSVFHTGECSWVPRRSQMEDMDDEEGNNTSKALQEVKIPVVGNNECRCTRGRRVTEKTVCAGPRADDDDDDSYEGDLGGPLIAKFVIFWIQFGIVSFGSGWANASTPRGYTRVSEYQDWITGIIMNNSLPAFIRFDYGEVDSDLNFTCPTHEPPTHGPPTREHPTDDRDDNSIFDSSESVISFSSFTHLASMCSLALYLWVFG